MFLRINQFLIESDFALPCDETLASGHTNGELLRVRRAAKALKTLAPSTLPAGSVRFQRAENGVLLGVDERIAMFVDSGGNTVEVQTRDEHLPEAALYVLGSALALCTALRGDVPLHASSVEIDGQRIALTAACGVGKSTTLWAFLEDGALFANDDLVPLRLQNKTACAASSVSLFPKIGRDLMARSPNDWSACREILPERGKFWFPLAAEKRTATTAPLRAIFALQPLKPLKPESSNEYSFAPVEAQRQSGMQAVSHLASNSMTGSVLSSLVGTPHLMTNFLSLAEIVPVFSLRYRKNFETLPHLVDAVRETLAALDSSTTDSPNCATTALATTALASTR